MKSWCFNVNGCNKDLSHRESVCLYTSAVSHNLFIEWTHTEHQKRHLLQQNVNGFIVSWEPEAFQMSDRTHDSLRSDCEKYLRSLYSIPDSSQNKYCTWKNLIHYYPYQKLPNDFSGKSAETMVFGALITIGKMMIICVVTMFF